MGAKFQACPGWHFVRHSDGSLEHVPGWRWALRGLWFLLTRSKVAP